MHKYLRKLTGSESQRAVEEQKQQSKDRIAQVQAQVANVKRKREEEHEAAKRQRKAAGKGPGRPPAVPSAVPPAVATCPVQPVQPEQPSDSNQAGRKRNSREAAAAAPPPAEPGRGIYWLTDMKGRKLSDRAASHLQDTMQSFVEFCKPRIKSLQEWQSGNVNITNTRNDYYSIITVCGDPKLTRRYGAVLKEGFFFELCSLITSCGCTVKQAQVVGSNSPPEEVANCLGCKLCMPAQNEHAKPQDPPYDFSLGPFYRFCVTDSEGKQLGAPQASAFLTMYNMIHGSGHMPLHAPNTDNYALAATGAYVE